MLYLIQQALKTAKQKEQEEELKGLIYGTSGESYTAYADFTEALTVKFPFQGTVMGVARKVNPNTLASDIEPKLATIQETMYGAIDYKVITPKHLYQTDRDIQRVKSVVEVGERFSDCRRSIEFLLNQKFRNIDSDYYDMIIEEYGETPEEFFTVDTFKEWLEEADVLLSNGTFEDSYDLEELINDYFDGYY